MRKRADLEFLGLGLLLLVVAIVIPTETEACSTNGFGQFCTQTIYTYDGVSAPIAKGILFAVAALCIAGGVMLLILRNKRQKRISTEQSTTTRISTPLDRNDVLAVAPSSQHSSNTSTSFVWNDVPAVAPSSQYSTAGVPLEKAARHKRRTILLVSVGSIILVLAVIGARMVTQAQTPSTTTFHQEVNTGPDIASIEVGTGLGDSAGSIQGQTDTFHGGTMVFVSFTLSSSTNSAGSSIETLLLQGSDIIYDEPISNLIGGLHYWHNQKTVIDPGVYKWVVKYNGNPEASITFQVVS